jgi:hypothetical protein
MMTYEMREGQGSLFANDRKSEEWHPEFRGKVMLPGGVVHWVDVKERVGARGRWLSLRIGREVGPGAVSRHEVEKSNGYQKPGGDEDIPF